MGGHLRVRQGGSNTYMTCTYIHVLVARVEKWSRQQLNATGTRYPICQLSGKNGAFSVLIGRGT